MAYGLRYFFRFESQAGVDFEIQILQDGYTGAATQRALGRTPVLRRELNGCIAGTSLEFFAECLVDGEFATLYTSDPYEFKVVLLQDSEIIWEGYVSPELYSEPDIAPPYDVSITATDGLGELRSATFVATGRWSLRELLDTLLEPTQLGYLVSSVSSIAAVAPTAVSEENFLDDVSVDLSHYTGESCYDVLQDLLASLHMRITQYRRDWFVYRETDIAETNGALVSHSPLGDPVSNPIGLVGSMNTSPWWPVGQLDSEIIAAKREVTLMSDNQYKQLIPNGEIVEDADWMKATSVTYNTDGYYVIEAGQAGLISQTVTLTDATAAGTTPVGQQRVPTRAQGFLGLRILASCMGTGEAEGKLIAMISGTFVDGTTRWLHKGESMYYWKDQNTGTPLTFSLGSPVATMSEDIATEISIDFPLYTEGSDTSLVKSLLIHVGAGSDTATDGYSRAIYAVVAEFTPQSKGVQTTLKINNGAREIASEVDTILVASEDTANAKYDLRFGIPYVGNTPIYTFGSSKISATDYLSFLAQDYGLSCAIPRLKKTGTLNVPAGSEIPMAFKDTNHLYMLETSAWSLYNDEVDIEMTSTPAASLTVESEVSQEIYAEGTSSYAPTYSSGGSGGGGDTPSSIAWSDITGKPSFAAVATSGSYNDLSNKPTIPSYTSQLVNDSGYITASALSGYATQSWVEGKGYITASAIPSSYAWSAITGKPTTLSGYGITDAAQGSSGDGYISMGFSGSFIVHYGTTSDWRLTAKGWQTEYKILHSDNYSDYALPLSGGTLTDQLFLKYANPRIVFQEADGTTEGTIGFYYGELSTYINNELFPIITSGNIGSYNAGSATKLETARTIWGQSFDGTGNVTGHAMGLGGYIDFQFNDEINRYGGNLYLQHRGDGSQSGTGTGATGNVVMCYNGGNVLIGTATDNGAKLQVNGITSSASYKCTGDIAGRLPDDNSSSWYTIYSYSGNNGDSAIISITNGYWNQRSNAVTLLVNTGWGGDATITQLSYNSAGSSAIGLARVRYINGVHYVDVLIYNVQANTDSFYVHGIGKGDFQGPTKVSDGSGVVTSLALAQNSMVLGGNLTASGNITASGEVTALGSSSSSDRRLKDIVSRPTPLLLEDIAKLNVISFTWNHRDNDKRLKLGLIAQEVKEVMPELVGVDRSNYYTLDYSTLGSVVGVMNTKKILSLEEEVIALRNEVKELRRKIYG